MNTRIMRIGILPGDYYLGLRLLAVVLAWMFGCQLFVWIGFKCTYNPYKISDNIVLLALGSIMIGLAINIICSDEIPRATTSRMGRNVFRVLVSAMALLALPVMLAFTVSGLVRESLPDILRVGIPLAIKWTIHIALWMTSYSMVRKIINIWRTDNP